MGKKSSRGNPYFVAEGNERQNVDVWVRDELGESDASEPQEGNQEDVERESDPFL